MAGGEEGSLWRGFDVKGWKIKGRVWGEKDAYNTEWDAARGNPQEPSLHGHGQRVGGGTKVDFTALEGLEMLVLVRECRGPGGTGSEC